MAQDFRINKVNYTLPYLPFIVDDRGDILGFQYQNGQITYFPCSGLDNDLTATPGGGQTNALKLNYRNARIATVAAAGDSVALPLATDAGLSIVVMNADARAMQVFGNFVAGDKINGEATGTGVSQMPFSMVEYRCIEAGRWITLDTIGTGSSGSFKTVSFANALTAFAGGGQASATQISTSLARFTTVATSGDSAKLPVAAPGLVVTVINAGAQPMNVFPSTGDAIDGLAANAALQLPVKSVFVFVSTVVGFWHSEKSINVVANATYSAAADVVGFTATAAQISGNAGYAGWVELDLTGAAATSALTLPTVANLLLAIPNAQIGHSYVLRVKNSGSANTWTITTNTGWTLTGTMTVATATWREVLITITSVASATATVQNLGGGATL